MNFTGLLPKFLATPLVILTVAAVTGCGTTEPEPEPLEPRALYGFDSCNAMLAYTQAHALEMLDTANGEYGFEIFDLGGFGGTDLAGEDSGDGEPGTNGPAHSETNVQEAGVDEPDLVKTDGERILALAQGQLHFVDASGLVPELLGSLDLPAGWDPQLFLNGDKALVMLRSDQWESELVEMPELWQGEYSWVPLTQLIEVDLSDPGAMQITRTLTVGADMISARMVDDSVRVVLRSWPVGLELKSWYEFYDGDGEGESEPGNPTAEPEPGEPPPPDEPDTGDPEPEPEPDPFRAGELTEEEEAKAAAKAHNEAVLASTSPENWLPQYVLDVDGEVSMGLLYDCSDAMRPGLASGLGVVSVLTISLENDLAVEDGTGVFSTGETVYASQDNLYVATHPWYGELFAGGGDAVVEEVPNQGEGAGGEGDPNGFRASEEPEFTSYVHKFDTSDPTSSEYVASGEVRGLLLNQFAMSEHEGQLRVASTDGFAWDEQNPSESFVTVLHEEDGELVLTGQVGGLGAGERVYAVRFVGEVAYVVTFRETDPLYTVDLSDPTAPAVLGELHINGYSAYLHPIDDTHLIGIGQDATDGGQTLGTQVSIFDVSDLAAPVRTHQYTLAEGYSEAEYDHHAFLYWQPESLAVFPMTVWSWEEQIDEVFTGVMALRVDPDTGIEELAAIGHPAPMDEYWAAQPRRSIVIEDSLYTVSELGLKASSLDDFSDLAWITF
ncbi:Beta propeller domain protein [Enhygromyxa salina]|uniref:Beta propeller domain protein n=1 Tax=Enhygromyxa salina TaxID=215803 RepID=A0A2S9XYD9_9BACT|nr:beta-propeller domain-containing protein [Enhygromyxa salina]PRP97866.1 Beta propeller domain protein [Enhygromyxa salina]